MADEIQKQSKEEQVKEIAEWRTILRKAIEAGNRPFDMERIEAAYRLAEEKHSGQFRQSGEPYIVHPLAVATIVAELGMDTESVMAALLHDVVEDTDVTLEQIEKLFGKEIASLVDGLTKLGRIPYSSPRRAAGGKYPENADRHGGRHSRDHHQAGRPAAQYAHHCALNRRKSSGITRWKAWRYLRRSRTGLVSATVKEELEDLSITNP